MILILSQEHDRSTDKVIEWLVYYDIKFIRINLENHLTISMSHEGVVLIIDAKLKINLSEVKAYWYRRGSFRFFAKLGKKPELASSFCSSVIEGDAIVLAEYLDYLLGNKRHINTFATGEVNKLIVLEIAKSVDLKIPDTYFIEDTKQVLDLFSSNSKRYITKNLSPMPVFEDLDWGFMLYTTEILKKNVANFHKNRFFPSLIQEYVEKLFELRIFFLNDNFYSMAIFSQLDDQTKIDFRKYNRAIPARRVPFNLPNEIKDKIIKLMRTLNLNCGSLDFIVDLDGNFYFLEVNPVGQFGMVSSPCNFFLEKEIVNYLNQES